MERNCSSCGFAIGKGQLMPPREGNGTLRFYCYAFVGCCCFCVCFGFAFGKTYVNSCVALLAAGVVLANL